MSHSPQRLPFLQTLHSTAVFTKDKAVCGGTEYSEELQEKTDLKRSGNSGLQGHFHSEMIEALGTDLSGMLACWGRLVRYNHGGETDILCE